MTLIVVLKGWIYVQVVNTIMHLRLVKVGNFG